jgi:geminin
LKVLQKTAIDKENLIGRTPAFIGKEQLAKKTSISELVSSTPDSNKRIKASTSSQSCQTSPSLEAVNKITEEDLTSDESVSEHYWEILAEKRRVALEESLVENEELYDRIGSLESELNESKKLLDETRSLVEVLTEMLQESSSADNSVLETSNIDGDDGDADPKKIQEN